MNLYVVTLVSVCGLLSQCVVAKFATCRKACQKVNEQLKKPAASASLLQADHENFKSTVDERIQLLTRAWTDTTSLMQNNFDAKVGDLSKTVENLRTELRNTRDALCPLRYNGKCFWAMFGEKVNYTDASKICARIPGGKPANIYDSEHMHATLRYLRGMTKRNSKIVYAWLGMTYDVENDKVYNSDGSLSSFIRWRKYNPDGSLDYTQLMIMARTDGNHEQEGMYNQNPEYKKPGVLCEV